MTTVEEVAQAVQRDSLGTSGWKPDLREAQTMKTAQGVTLIANGQLVDGTGPAASTGRATSRMMIARVWWEREIRPAGSSRSSRISEAAGAPPSAAQSSRPNS
jgi:hypothetical protein